MAAVPDTRLLMIPRSEIEKAFSSKEQERLLIMSQVQFPTEKQVLADVDVVKAVQRFKKHAFMDSVNTNKLARDMRPELLGAKVQKVREWVDNVDGKVQERLEERIKIKAKEEIRKGMRERGVKATDSKAADWDGKLNAKKAATQRRKTIVTMGTVDGDKALAVPKKMNQLKSSMPHRSSAQSIHSKSPARNQS